MTACVGRVVALSRFPVKSMAGEKLQEAEIDWQGIEGDRQYGFYFGDDETRFPWLTGRQLSELVLHRPSFADGARPRTSAVAVDAPDGEPFALTDPRLAQRLAEKAGRPVRLMQSGRGMHDAMPVSIVTTASHRAVEEAHGSALDQRRFRTNIVIESDASEAAWQGAQIAFASGAALLCTAPIPRCAMIVIDPDTGARDPSILRTVAQQFGNAYGAYAAPARMGHVRVGDAVHLL